MCIKRNILKFNLIKQKHTSTNTQKNGEVERKWKFQGGISNLSVCGGEHETVYEQEAATECWYTFSYQNMWGRRLKNLNQDAKI